MRSRRRGPVPRSPDAPERIYTEQLRAFSREISRTIRAYVLPKYDRNVEVRTDAPDRFGIDWGKLRTIVGRVAADRSEDLADAQVKRVKRFNREDMARILPIDFASETPAVKKALAKARRDSVALIRSIAAEQLADVRAVVREYATAGRRVEELAAELRERFDVSESRAELIARDQTLKANAALTEVRHKEAGIERYVWSTSRDERVRPMHQALEGRIFRYDEEPPVTNPQGDRNKPGEDYQCRCVAVPLLD